MKTKYYLHNLITSDYHYIDDNQINFEFRFNKELPVLPNTIKKINFGDNFNKKLDILPILLIQLKTSSKFNQYIDNLPLNLKTLKFNNQYINHYNNSIDNLPHNLMNLKFGDSFNQNIKNLPNNLISLTICHKFNKSFGKIPNIQYLICKGNIQLINLPNSIKKLYINSFEYNKLLDMLPEGIEILKINSNKLKINDLPSSIKEIHIYESNIKNINIIYHDKIKFLSDDLEYDYTTDKLLLIKYFYWSIKNKLCGNYRYNDE